MFLTCSIHLCPTWPVVSKAPFLSELKMQLSLCPEAG